MSGQKGGYVANFIDGVPDRNICSICTKTLRDPHLVVCCGQHYCSSCLNHWFKKHSIVSCPNCRAGGDDFHYVTDKKLKREILALKVKCNYFQDGCEWTGELESLSDHIESPNGCGYAELECPNKCYTVTWKPQARKTTKVRRSNLRNHLKNECHNRQYQCEHCGKRDKYIKITGDGSNFTMPYSHHKECSEMIIDCPNKCGERMRRKETDNHRKGCTHEYIQCPNDCMVEEQPEDAEGAKTATKVKITTKVKVMRKDIEKHMKDECYLRPYTCGHCSLESTYEAITGSGAHKQPTSHYQVCPEYPVPCPNNCGVDPIKRKNMQAHRSQCPDEIVLCPNKCFQSAGELKRKDFNKHIAEECPLREFLCAHCNKLDTYHTIVNIHYSECLKYPLKCPNKCSPKKIMRENMASHHKECPLQPVECPFTEAGCKAKLVRQELEEHISTTQVQHQLMVMRAFKELKRDHVRMREELKRTKSKLQQNTEQKITPLLEQRSQSESSLEASKN